MFHFEGVVGNQFDEVRDIFPVLAADVNGVEDVGESALVRLLVHEEHLPDEARHGLLVVLGVLSRVLQKVEVRANDDHRRPWGTGLEGRKRFI